MIKKLSKHGNSLAILIDKPILDLLGMDENTHINIKTDGINIIIEPIKIQQKVSVISKDPKTQKIYEELIGKYDALFRKLAKN
jgi:antitoxin component of MazEF toxin-antitoxin module